MRHFYLVLGILTLLISQSFADLRDSYNSFQECNNDIMGNVTDSYKEAWAQTCRKVFPDLRK